MEDLIPARPRPGGGASDIAEKVLLNDLIPAPRGRGTQPGGADRWRGAAHYTGGVEPLPIVLIGMLIIVACQFAAPRVGVASPLILLGVGLAIGFLPVVAPVRIDPHIVLEMVLPPLLFSAAVRMPTMDFRRELSAVAMLAIPLVVISAAAIGFLVNWMVPQISLPWAIALGAVISPTDAVAVSIAKRSGVAHRIITVLEGEGLFNDATALVLLAAATSAGVAASENALNPGALASAFLIALVVAIGVGWAVGELGVRVRARLKDPTSDTVFSFAMPFLASIPAEHLGGSGLVAAVVAGLVVSIRRVGLISANNRRFATQNWSTVTVVLESGVFLMMGLQAYGIVTDEATGTGYEGLGRAALVAVVAGGATVAVRAGFVSALLVWLDHRRKHSKRRHERDEARIGVFEERLADACTVDEEVLQARNLSEEEWHAALNRWHRRLDRVQRRQTRRGSDLEYFANEPLGPREGAVVVWAGMRGAITLAASQTIAQDVPMRGFLLLVALLVAAGSLIIQGLTLPAVIRLVRPQMASGEVDDEERRLLAKVMGSALVDTALAQAIQEMDGKEVVQAGLSRTLVRIEHAQGGGSAPPRTAERVIDGLRAGLADAPAGAGAGGAGPAEGSDDADEVARAFTRSQIRELALEAIHAQREALLDARGEGLFSSVALDGALARLDNEEILLVSGSHGLDH